MKKILSVVLTVALTATLFTGCSGPVAMVGGSGGGTAVKSLSGQSAPVQVKAPKYVFLFIGDGMSYPQFQSAADYLGAIADSDYMQAVPSLDDNQGAVLDGPVALNFMDFETVGSVPETRAVPRRRPRHQ